MRLPDHMRSNEIPFTTNRPGVSVMLWSESLGLSPVCLPHSRAVSVVSPHPDDDTLGAGGLIFTCAELGYEITIILVTDVEAAFAGEPRLRERRFDELRASLMRIAP